MIMVENFPKKFLKVILLLFAVSVSVRAEQQPLKIGWIGPMTGAMSKFGAARAAQLAVEDINLAGGINGRLVKLIQEDAQGKGTLAVSAFQKLTGADGVRFIVGGHCTPESAAIAPLAEKSGVVVLAATTSSPKLSGIDPFFARTTYVSTVSGAMVAEYAFQGAAVRRLAILQEQTDYVLPVAAKVREVFEQNGGKVVAVFEVPYGELDFRTVVLRVKASDAQGVYIGVQAPDTARIFIRQLREFGFQGKLFGNESVGSIGNADPAGAVSFEGVVFAEPAFDLEADPVAHLSQRFKEKFDQAALPAGFHTADAYDAVRLLADTIGKCGEDPKEVARCLRRTTDYQGVTGKISINSSGDGVREVVLKKIGADGKPRKL